MPASDTVRTFVTLETKELEFVRTLQKLVQVRSGRKKPAPLHHIIRGVLLDYKRLLELASDPDFLAAYDDIKSRNPSKRRRCNQAVSR